METPETASVFWVNILERDGWFVTHIDGRPLGIIVSTTEVGSQHLKVAGFHLGESMFVGDRQNILSIKVERVQQSQQKEILPKIHQALPAELRGLPVAFL